MHVTRVRYACKTQAAAVEEQSTHRENTMKDETYPVYGEITGPIVMIGFGSIGRGTLPLIERHFKFDKSRMVVIDPREEPSDMEILKKHGIRHIKDHVTK